MTLPFDVASLPVDPFIDGKRISTTHPDVFPTYDPAARSVLCDVPVSREGLVNEAAQSAKRAPWAKVTPAERF